MKEIPDIAISAEKVAAILTIARRFDVKDVVTDPDSGSNASDDAMAAVLEDHSDGPASAELVASPVDPTPSRPRVDPFAQRHARL
jgi:hypothetical protein